MKKARFFVTVLLIAVLAANAAGCAKPVKAAGLMSGISSKSVSGKTADLFFTESVAGFSIELFKASVSDRENSLISPLSVILALAMTANGADNETLKQMERVMGGGIPIAELNEYLYAYVKNLPNKNKSKLAIANSIWFNDSENKLQVEKEFLQNNADYYQADAYAAPFDSRTLKDINNWVKSNTDGMIDNILTEISPDQIMFLINAVMFDAEWQNVYNKENVRKGDFTDINGAKHNVDFMHGTEGVYLDDGMATGFIKPYANGGYSFAALLPNEGVPIETYIDNLSGAGFLGVINNATSEMVFTSMPKFEYEYTKTMNDALQFLGMPDAFSAVQADFGKIGASPMGNIFISLVLHKTYISVDELGTRAGAVTMVAMTGGGMMSDPKVVNLDRPFVYAIIDNATNLPLFIGSLMTL